MIIQQKRISINSTEKNFIVLTLGYGTKMPIINEIFGFQLHEMIKAQIKRKMKKRSYKNEF